MHEAREVLRLGACIELQDLHSKGILNSSDLLFEFALCHIPAQAAARTSESKHEDDGELHAAL